MNIELQTAKLKDKLILCHLMEQCQHDYSKVNGAEVNEHRLFGYPYLA